MNIFASMNASCLATFGESVTFATSIGLVTLTGIVDRPGAPSSRRVVDAAAFSSAAAAFSSAVFGPDDIIVTLTSSAVADNCIAARDTAEIDGHTYTINGIWPDSGGMTALELRA